MVSAFVGVLDALAQSALDLQEEGAEDIAAQCRHYSQKILASNLDTPDQAGSLNEVWGEACEFAVKLIRNERDFAVTRFDDFRQMIWVVIQGLREAFRDEQMAESEMSEHLDRLRGAVDSDSIDELRNEVVAAVVLISRAIEDRKKRQRVQLEELGAQLSRMRMELLEAQRELALDSMTRLYNRGSFDQLLARTIELSVFSGQSSCLLMLDIDHFKRINDTYGHVCGDKAVMEVTKHLKRTFPRKTDFVARYGGDEFAVILQDTSAHDGEMLAKRLLGGVRAEKCTTEGGAAVELSLSVGVAELKKDDAPTDWVCRADQALYQAKRAGRGCVWLAKG